MPPSKTSNFGTKTSDDLEPDDFGCLIRPPVGEEQSWDVDVAGILKRFILKVRREKQVNFIQASFIIKGAVIVYGNKVESLHKLVNTVATRDADEVQPEAVSSRRRISKRREETEFVSLDGITSVDRAALDLAGGLDSYETPKRNTFTSGWSFLRDDFQTGDWHLVDISGEVYGRKCDLYMRRCVPQACGAFLLPTVCGNVADFKVPEEGDSASDDGVLIEEEDVAERRDDGNSEEYGWVPDDDDALLEECVADHDGYGGSVVEASTYEQAEFVPFVFEAYNRREEVQQKRLKRRRSRSEHLSFKRPRPLAHRVGNKCNALGTAMAVVQHENAEPSNERNEADGMQFPENFPGSIAEQSRENYFSPPLFCTPPTPDDGDDEDNACGPPSQSYPVINGMPSEERSENIAGNSPEYQSYIESESFPCSSGTIYSPSLADDRDQDCFQYEEIMRSYWDLATSLAPSDDLHRKVREWEQKVKPILNETKQRECFDISEYGDRLLDHFEVTLDGTEDLEESFSTNEKPVVSLEDVCKGMRNWEICRYFLAALQMANDYCVEIQPKKSSRNSDHIQLSLLSIERYRNRSSQGRSICNSSQTYASCEKNPSGSFADGQELEDRPRTAIQEDISSVEQDSQLLMSTTQIVPFFPLSVEESANEGAGILDGQRHGGKSQFFVDEEEIQGAKTTALPVAEARIPLETIDNVRGCQSWSDRERTRECIQLVNVSHPHQPNTEPPSDDAVRRYLVPLASSQLSKPVKKLTNANPGFGDPYNGKSYLSAPCIPETCERNREPKVEMRNYSKKRKPEQQVPATESSLGDSPTGVATHAKRRFVLPRKQATSTFTRMGKQTGLSSDPVEEPMTSGELFKSAVELYEDPVIPSGPPSNSLFPISKGRHVVRNTVHSDCHGVSKASDCWRPATGPTEMNYYVCPGSGQIFHTFVKDPTRDPVIEKDVGVKAGNSQEVQEAQQVRDSPPSEENPTSRIGESSILVISVPPATRRGTEEPQSKLSSPEERNAPTHAKVLNRSQVSVDDDDTAENTDKVRKHPDEVCTSGCSRSQHESISGSENVEHSMKRASTGFEKQSRVMVGSHQSTKSRAREDDNWQHLGKPGRFPVPDDKENEPVFRDARITGVDHHHDDGSATGRSDFHVATDREYRSLKQDGGNDLTVAEKRFIPRKSIEKTLSDLTNIEHHDCSGVIARKNTFVTSGAIQPRDQNPRPKPTAAIGLLYEKTRND